MKKYGLLGYPLGHSFSRNYFNQKFEAEKIDAEYLNFEIPEIKEIKNVIKENPELNGLNVTIPYKEQVIRAPNRCRQRDQVLERIIWQSETERLQLRHHRLQAIH